MRCRRSSDWRLVMFAIEKMPQKDVAEVLECSVEAVKWHVFTGAEATSEKFGSLFFMGVCKLMTQPFEVLGCLI